MNDHEDFQRRRFRQILAAALDEARPERYLVVDTTDEDKDEDEEGIEWINAVADAHAHMLPESAVRRIHARVVANGIESRNLRRGNRIIRDMWESDQPDLGWLDQAKYPAQVVHRIHEQGKRPRIKRSRVKVTAMTSADLRLFADEERRNAMRENAVRERTCVSAEKIAAEMDEYGDKILKGWLDRRLDDDEAASGTVGATRR